MKRYFLRYNSYNSDKYFYYKSQFAEEAEMGVCFFTMHGKIAAVLVIFLEVTFW